jgi:hypothetical protein
MAQRVYICCDINILAVVEHQRSLRGTRGAAMLDISKEANEKSFVNVLQHGSDDITCAEELLSLHLMYGNQQTFEYCLQCFIFDSIFNVIKVPRIIIINK